MPGLISSKANVLTLNRFLDGENISDTIFEAELYRFSEFLRILRNMIGWNKVPARTVSDM